MGALVGVVVVVVALAAGACSDSGASPGSAERRPTTVADGQAGTPSTAAPPDGETALVDAVCDDSAELTDAGRIDAPEVTEASGLVASWDNHGDGVAGPWWVHNDSGASARIYAIDGTGGLRATVELVGAENRDWEDIAIGPSAMPGGRQQLYVGDIGNNKVRLGDSAARKTVRIYRLDEPVLGAPGPAGTPPPVLKATVTSFTLRYPDRTADAEALVIDPISGDLWLITKDWTFRGTSFVYRVPAAASIKNGATVDLIPAGEIHVGFGALVTAADVTRDGSVVALRSYGAVALYRRPEGRPLGDAFTTEPCKGPVPTEMQGESIAFAPDGGSYLTVSEGSDPMLHRTSP